MKDRTKIITGAVIILFLIVFAKGELPAILIGKSFSEAMPGLMLFAAKAAIGAGIIYGTIALYRTAKNKAGRKTLIAVAAVILVLLAGAGIYVANGIRHKPEYFRQLLTQTAQEDADKLFGKSDLPLLDLYRSDDNLLNAEGEHVTYGDLWNASTKLSLYQSKVDELVKDIKEYRIGDIVVQEKDPSFGNMDTADVPVFFKWYDFSSVLGDFNRQAYNKLLPYMMVGTENSFPIIDELLLSILEKAEAAGMTREYEAVYKYYLSEAGSNPITGKGSYWSERAQNRDLIREMILKELDYVNGYKDDPTEKELNERKEIAVNMQVAIELYGKDGAKEYLEELGYEGLVAKMIAEHPSEESTDQQG